jgi:Holliday junction resolvase RusA-like endonuclease
MTQRDRWKNRPCVEKYYSFKDELKSLWGDREVPDCCHLVFRLPMPMSWSEKKRLLMTGKPHRQKPDVDNLAKAFFDSLLTDDAYIYDIRASKYWDEEGSIEVKELF